MDFVSQAHRKKKAEEKTEVEEGKKKSQFSHLWIFGLGDMFLLSAWGLQAVPHHQVCEGFDALSTRWLSLCAAYSKFNVRFERFKSFFFSAGNKSLRYI